MTTKEKLVTIKNVSPLGDLEIPLLGWRFVLPANETVAVTEEQAEVLLQQEETYQRVEGKS